MVQNFEFKDGYGFYKLRPSVGRSKMTNRLHASPVVEESMPRGKNGVDPYFLADRCQKLYELGTGKIK